MTLFLCVNGDSVSLSDKVRDLEILLNSNLTMIPKINKVLKLGQQLFVHNYIPKGLVGNGVHL